MRKKRTDISIAVPFWGKGALKSLGIRRGTKARILCNLTSLACNPLVVEKLWLLKPAVKVRSHPRLHAKLYAGDEFLIVGSSNASMNGLTVEGDELKGWIEANVLTDDKALVAKGAKLFKTVWNAEETTPVTRASLTAAKRAWKLRPRPTANTNTSKSIFECCRRSPEQFEHVYVFAYDQGLGKRQTKTLREVRKNAAAPNSNREGDFRKAWGFDFGDDRVKQDCWIIDLNCKTPNRPTISGAARVTGLLLKDVNLTLAIPGRVRSLAGQSFSIRSGEKAALKRNRKRFLRRGLVLLPQALRIIDGKR